MVVIPETKSQRYVRFTIGSWHTVEELRTGATQVLNVSTADEERAWAILRHFV
jgi:hypothetical protein